MNAPTYRCCKHCSNPCPATGHSSKCDTCVTNGRGRKVAEAHHFPPGTVRDWDPVTGVAYSRMRRRRLRVVS